MKLTIILIHKNNNLFIIYFIRPLLIFFYVVKIFQSPLEQIFYNFINTTSSLKLF